MNNNSYNTSIQNAISDFNSDLERQELKDKVLKTAGIVGGSAIAGAAVAVTAEEYDKTDKINSEAKKIANEKVEETAENSTEEESIVAENTIEPNKSAVSHSNPASHTETVTTIETHTETIVEEEIVSYEEEHIYTSQQPIEEKVAVQPVEQVPEDFKVEVISVHQNVDIAGQDMDIAIVDINDEPTLFIDVDQNGVADIFAADINNNGHLEKDELYDIREGHIPMPLDPNASMGMISDIPDYSTNDDITLVEL